MNATTTTGARRWLWIAAVWSAIGLFEATETVFGMRAEGMHHNWGALFVTVFLSWLPWVLVTPLALRLRQKYPLKPIMWLVHAGVAVLVNVVAAAWMAGMILL